MKIRVKKRIAAALCLGVFAASSSIAIAQDDTRRIDPRRVIDALRERLSAVETDRPIEGDGTSAVIDFEIIRGDDPRRAVPLTNQYENTHGIVFGSGVSVHLCTNSYDEFSRSSCPYPQAASGSRAALYEVPTGGAGAMSLAFADGVSVVAMKINPTGGTLDEEFIAQINGFDASGQRISTSSLRFNWYQDAFAWPTEVSLTGKSAISRVTVELRRVASNNQPVRFLIDDLSLTKSADIPVPPVAAGLSQLDGPPKAGRGTVVQSPRVGPAQSGLQIYPASTRKRLAVDWNAVDAALADQAALGLVAASPVRDGQKYIDQAELPILLPQAPDPGTLMVFGNRNTINAVWRVGGRGYSAYGSRLVTVLKKPAGAPGVREAITFSGSEDELTGAFALYGVSWTVTQHCLDGGESADPACYDRDMLGAVAGDLIVAVGDAGRARP